MTYAVITYVFVDNTDLSKKTSQLKKLSGPKDSLRAVICNRSVLDRYIINVIKIMQFDPLTL